MKATSGGGGGGGDESGRERESEAAAPEEGREREREGEAVRRLSIHPVLAAVAAARIEMRTRERREDSTDTEGGRAAIFPLALKYFRIACLSSCNVPESYFGHWVFNLRDKCFYPG